MPASLHGQAYLLNSNQAGTLACLNSHQIPNLGFLASDKDCQHPQRTTAAGCTLSTNSLSCPDPNGRHTLRARVRCLVASFTTFSSTGSPLRRRTDKTTHTSLY